MISSEIVGVGFLLCAMPHVQDDQLIADDTEINFVMEARHDTDQHTVFDGRSSDVGIVAQ